MPTTLTEARELFAASEVARDGVRRGGRRALPQQRARRARGLRVRRHRLGASTGVRAAVIADTRLRAGPIDHRVRGDAGAARHRDQARPAAAGHAAAGRARAVRAARDRPLHAAPGADRAGAVRAPARRARPRRRDVRRRCRRAPAPRAGGACSTGATAATCGSRSSSASRCWPPSAPSAEAIARLDALVDRDGARRWTTSPPTGGRRALPRRPGRGDRLARARGGDDRGPGRDDRPDQLHRAPARGARVVQRAARAARRLPASGAIRRSRCGSWPTICAAPSTCSPACCLDARYTAA